ncbi:MAG: hypothetical protein DI527_11525 [Chelatococcus sp.]|nr:MAG: hypothetical protein DI527_11525 [Chelatococcus sp.]
MSEARSLTPLSENDYEAIELAVMETARGRWFMKEYARRNRQSDTNQLLNAIGRIERIVGLNLQRQAPEPDIGEAAALIGDLRMDLERISGRAHERSSGLAARIEDAAATIATAVESVQDVAWSLREAGADDALCEKLDRRAVEISAAIAVVDSTVQRIDKIADTIAMLDSSLRAIADMSTVTALGDFESPMPSAHDFSMPASHAGIDVVEMGADQPPVAAPASRSSVSGSLDLTPADPHVGTIGLLDEDIVFTDLNDDTLPIVPPAVGSGTSEAGLRAIDEMEPARKLAYFG